MMHGGIEKGKGKKWEEIGNEEKMMEKERQKEEVEVSGIMEI